MPDIERLDFEDVDKEKLKDFVKALEYIFTDGIAGDVDTPKFNKTYETIRNYSKKRGIHLKRN